MILQYLITGIMIGLIFGMPIGAVGAVSIQRTITNGPLAGFISGAASSTADALYACIGAFGLTLISNFLLDHQMTINLIGSLLMIVIAVQMLRKKERLIISKDTDIKKNFKIFISSFAIALANPAAIISFLFAFSAFDIHGALSLSDGFQLVIGVFIGTICWWIILVVVMNKMRQKINAEWFYRLNIFFGVILIIFSCCIAIKTI